MTVEEVMIENKIKATDERWPTPTMQMAEETHNMRMEFGLGFELGWQAAMGLLKKDVVYVELCSREHNMGESVMARLERGKRIVTISDDCKIIYPKEFVDANEWIK